MNVHSSLGRKIVSVRSFSEQIFGNYCIIEKYSLLGFAFGVLFPSGAWLLDIYYHCLSFTLESIIQIHNINPIHFIVDSAPLILGIACHYVGVKIQRTNEEHNLKLEKAYNKLSSYNNRLNDSMAYAEKIQTAIVPSREEIGNCFSKSFLIHKSKDIIGGDYFWCVKKGDKIQFGVVDCTGHGVPGAMMTMVSHLLLEKEANINGIDNPVKNLESLDKEIKKVLKQKGKGHYLMDGMDLSLCTYDLQTKELIFAGANRPLFLTSNNEVKVIKGTRRGLGGGSEIKRSFENHRISLNKGERIFLFSDGIVDQFNKAGTRKYSSKRLQEFILKSIPDSFSTIEQRFKKEFIDWKGSGSQTDDCILFGFEVD